VSIVSAQLLFPIKLRPTPRQAGVGYTSDAGNAFAKLVPSADDDRPVAGAVFDDHSALADAEIECWTLGARLQLKQAGRSASKQTIVRLQLKKCFDTVSLAPGRAPGL